MLNQCKSLNLNFQNFYFNKNNSKSRETDRRKEKKINALKVTFQVIKNNIDYLKSHLKKKEEFLGFIVTKA